jgi:hypothetical protein
VPVARFREKFGDLSGEQIHERIRALAEQFLHEAGPAERRKEPVRA